jgi:hypothetical protein
VKYWITDNRNNGISVSRKIKFFKAKRWMVKHGITGFSGIIFFGVTDLG